MISGFCGLIDAFSSLSPELIQDVPSVKNVLVFAPHCDDEALGCGGTLHKHHLKGNKITAVFMTDGSKCEFARNIGDIVGLRKNEARRAAGILGIGRCIFLDYPDRALRNTDESVRRVEGILTEVQPDFVYLPFYLDNHPDHMATAEICLRALRACPAETILFYEIWNTLIPNQLVDITHVMDKKLEAVRAYKSQHDIESLADQTKSLNRYRTINTDNKYYYAEAFLKLNSTLLNKLLR